MTLDRPRIRASLTCPLCDKPKDTGLVVCWRCYRLHNMRHPSAALNARIDCAEAALAAA